MKTFKEIKEAANAAQQAAIAVNMKKAGKKPKDMKENHIAVAMGREIDDEGGMIMSQLDTIENAVQRLRGMVQDPKMQLPGWVQSKVTLACDYIDTAADYMTSKTEEVDYVDESAWTKKEGQNKNGGLNEKGRKSYERENPGSDLKAPSKKVGNPRRASFCARMKGMRKRQKDSNNTGEDRLSKSLRAWNC